MRQVKTDFRSAPLDPQTYALLEFAEKLTLTPYKIGDEDIAHLQEVGWGEEAIVQTIHIAGIFNYLVRLADAFGLEWEPEVKASATHQPELWQQNDRKSKIR